MTHPAPWRRLFAEFVGTVLLVTAGGVLVAHPDLDAEPADPAARVQ
jgi:hypothetical protein